MHSSILTKLEAARKELLDLGLRNPLIHYKQPKSKGLQVVRERAVNVYQLLVKEGKAMSFTGLPEKGDKLPAMDDAKPADDALLQTYTDTKLQTDETEPTLQHKLLNTYYAARTSLEEQGVNTLFISLGMLAWYEAVNSNEPRQAPLILVPVTVERSSARERFRIKYSEEEPGHNLSLQAKLKAEFGLALPDLPSDEEVDVAAYFTQVSSAVESQARWTVLPDQIALGFFSFGKFMIYHDLDNNEWPEEARPVDHPLLSSLFEEGFTDAQPSAGGEAFIDDDTTAHKLFQVADADSSQILAMLAVNEGRNLVIQGPPGTGKSQTITNIIANAIGQGQKVLFVAEKMAALDVVKRRMDNIALGEACLELHSHKANKKELHYELKRVLELGKPSLQKLREEVGLLAKHKEEINAYSLAVNTPIRNSGLTVQKIYGLLLQIRDAIGDKVLPKINLPEIEAWDAERQRAAEAMAERIQARLHDVDIPARLPFWGTGLTVLLPQQEAEIINALNDGRAAVEKLQGLSGQIAETMFLPSPTKREDALKLATWVQAASVKPDLQGLSIENKAWLLQKADVEELLSTGAQLAALKERHAAIFLPEAWELNVLEIRQSLKEHGSKWYRFLIGSYTKAVKTLGSVCAGSLPKELELKISYTEDILAAQRLSAALQEYDALAKELFGTRYQKAKTDWASLKAAADYLQTVHQGVVEGHYPKELLVYLARQEASSIAKANHDALLSALHNHGRKIQGVMDLLMMNEGLRFSNNSFQHLPFATQAAALLEWKEKLADLPLSVSWNNLANTATD